MFKLFPLIVILTLIFTLFVGVLVFFSGLQFIVSTMPELKNSWLAILGMCVWMFACLFIAMSGVEYVLNKAKLHLSSAS